MSWSPGTSSGLKTSSAAICALSCRLKSVQITGAHSAAATIIVYDNATTNAGTVVAKAVVPANTPFLIDLGSDVVCSNGLYVSIAGTAAEAIITYELSA